MQLAYFSGTVIAMSLALSLTFLKALKMLMTRLENQEERITTLTNLAAAKDLTSFQNLQGMTNRLPRSVELVNPLDDASVAERLAQQYAEQGIDPLNAYAQDPDDPFQDFGGIDAIRTH